MRSWRELRITSDHGQQHLERARWSHGNHLHQEETGAIAAIWAQNLSPASWSGLTVHQDVAATLNALYGLGLESVTGLPLGEADATRPRMQQYYRNHLSETTAVPRQSLETEEWRLSYAWDGVQRLHHRQEDPAELTDQLELADPQVLVDLWDQLQPQVDRLQETLLPHHTPEGSGP